VLSVAQFHALMREIGINVTVPECKNFMLGFTGGKAYMAFADFFQNLLGFPHDFFQMKLSTVNHNVKEKPQRDLVRKLPEGSDPNVLAAMFVKALRKELYDVSASMRAVLRKEKNQTGLNADDVYKLFHMQGITLNKVELQEIVDHFDFDMDGHMNCAELTHELLDLPLPAHIRNSLPVPRRESRPKLGARTRQLMELLRQQCRRAAVSHKKLDRLFTVYDKDGSGSIAYDEIQAMVKEFHLEVHNGDAAALILDKFAPSGAMSYEDFCTKVVGLPAGAHKSKEVDPEVLRLKPQVLRDQISHAIKKKVYTDPSAVKRAFVMFDKDMGGEISQIEFQQGFNDLKLPATKKQVNSLFAQYDPKGAGYLSTSEFARASLELDDETPPPSAATRLSRQSNNKLKSRGALSKMGIGSGLGTLSRPATGRSVGSPIPQMAQLSSPAILSRPASQMSRHSYSRGAPPRSASSMC
jgi:Ca2+-binding EF-hand superfamily protein